MRVRGRNVVLMVVSRVSVTEGDWGACPGVDEGRDVDGRSRQRHRLRHYRVCGVFWREGAERG